MKASFFNYFVERPDGKYIAFNSFSGALAVVPPRFKSLVETIDQQRGENLRDQDQVLASLLKDTGFIVDSDLDEVKEVSINMEARKHDLSVLGLTIMPTSTCNLNCVYCYEKSHASTMNDATVDELVAFADQRMATVKHLAVTWYGGEPLVAVDQIERISHKLNELCERHGATFSAGVITNGTLLTRDVARRLVDACGVTYCQVTLDGPRDVHNARRPYSGGRGSFDVIVDNIKAVHDVLDINVRVNVDKDNVDHLSGLLDHLATHDLQDKIKMHIGMTEPLGEVRKCPDLISKCLDDSVLPPIQIRFHQEAVERGFHPQFYLMPANIYGLCAAEIINSFVVEPNGDLQKCWVTVGHPDEAVGSVRRGVPPSAKLQEWIGFDPLKHPECRSCKELPLCWGNCVYRNRGTDAPQCGMWKYELAKVLDKVEEFEAINKTRQGYGQDDSSAVIRPTFVTRAKAAEFDAAAMDQDEIDWVNAGKASRRRCCFIVCPRCTTLEVDVSCRPTFGGRRPSKQAYQL